MQNRTMPHVVSNRRTEQAWRRARCAFPAQCQVATATLRNCPSEVSRFSSEFGNSRTEAP